MFEVPNPQLPCNSLKKVLEGSHEKICKNQIFQVENRRIDNSNGNLIKQIPQMPLAKFIGQNFILRNAFLNFIQMRANANAYRVSADSPAINCGPKPSNWFP